MSDKVFIDSNVLLYSLDNSSTKKKNKVKSILRDSECYISPQVVFECLNVITRKFKLSKKEALAFLTSISKFVVITSEDSSTVSKALELYRKHSLQGFDAKIVASALLTGCNILYSEDMQNGFMIERKLKIINPFV